MEVNLAAKRLKDFFPEDIEFYNFGGAGTVVPKPDNSTHTGTYYSTFMTILWDTKHEMKLDGKGDQKDGSKHYVIVELTPTRLSSSFDVDTLTFAFNIGEAVQKLLKHRK